MNGFREKAVEAFVSLARRYREVIEARDPDDVAAFLRDVQPLLAGLCRGALALPTLAKIDLPDGADEDFTRDEAHALVERSRPLNEALADELGDDAYYWDLLDPYDEADPVEASLADDLTDIFVDLDEGLRRWEGADAELRRSIVFEWRYTYENHWAQHAMGAMRAIHALLYVHGLGEEDEYDDA
jgi:Domain of unknown function (DUF5063)